MSWKYGTDNFGSIIMSPEKFSFEKSENPLDRELAECTFLSANDKADIVLMMEGKKDAAVISTIGSLGDRSAEELFEKNTAHIQRILKSAHLPYDFFREREGRFITASFCVGSNMATMEKLRVVRDMKDIRAKTAAEGRLFGFPETAIEGYLHDKRKDNKTLPEEIRSSEAMPFLNFRLSEDHWQDEWKTVAARAEQVGALAPAIYRSMTHRAE